VNTKGIIILGAGGHAKVVIEAIEASGDTAAYCIGSCGSSTTLLNVPILPDESHLDRLRVEGYQRAFIAIGASAVRERLGNLVVGKGFNLVTVIHPKAWVSPSAHLGNGVVVMAGAMINACAVIGDLAIINTGSTIDHDCNVGRAAHIAPQCGIAGSVTIGSGTMLGVGTKVIPGISIGSNAMIGAGSVVVRNIPEGALAMGIPARITLRSPS
jgi:UDP-perosamine 4-acetyltransferase